MVAAKLLGYKTTTGLSEMLMHTFVSHLLDLYFAHMGDSRCHPKAAKLEISPWEIKRSTGF